MDLETGAIVAVTLQEADQGDTTTIQTTLPKAVEQLEAVAAVTDNRVRAGEELFTDKGYHSKHTVLDVQTLGMRSYMSEPDHGGSTRSISMPSATHRVCPLAAH
jgi:hypothetical protein